MLALAALSQNSSIVRAELHFAANEGLEGDDGLGGKGVRDDLSLTGVLGTVARVEETAREGTRRHKGVVVGGLEGSGSVPVDGMQGLVVGDRDVVGCDPDEFACHSEDTR